MQCIFIEINETMRNEGYVQIKLVEINPIENMSFMFDECSDLNSLPDLSKWNTSNVTNMDFMFYECSSLFSLPDITKWDTTNVINMSFMFDKCDEGLDIPLKFKK